MKKFLLFILVHSSIFALIVPVKVYDKQGRQIYEYDASINWNPRVTTDLGLATELIKAVDEQFYWVPGVDEPTNYAPAIFACKPIIRVYVQPRERLDICTIPWFFNIDMCLTTIASRVQPIGDAFLLNAEIRCTK